MQDAAIIFVVMETVFSYDDYYVYSPCKGNAGNPVEAFLDPKKANMACLARNISAVKDTLLSNKVYEYAENYIDFVDIERAREIALENEINFDEIPVDEEYIEKIKKFDPGRNYAIDCLKAIYMLENNLSQEVAVYLFGHIFAIPFYKVSAVRISD